MSLLVDHYFLMSLLLLVGHHVSLLVFMSLVTLSHVTHQPWQVVWVTEATVSRCHSVIVSACSSVTRRSLQSQEYSIKVSSAVPADPGVITTALLHLQWPSRGGPSLVPDMADVDR